MHVVNRPRDARVVKLRELFSVKFDNITKEWIFKVRIVARGDLEVDEEFVYAPVANMPALRLFVVLSLEFGIDFRQLDISSAFLYGRLDHDIYVELPDGHPEKQGNTKVWKTRCALYGLQTAPKVWNETIDGFLRDFGLHPLVTESCMYVLMKKGRLALVVLLYVDDVLYTGDVDEIARFEKEIARRFDLKSTTQATSYLGIDIAQNHRRGEVILSQPTYIKEAIERFKLQDAKRVRTPLATLANKPELTAPLLTDRRLYQAMVGVLLYINLTTRPDISYAVHFLTRYTAAPTQYHLSCAKRVLIYLRDTAHHGLIYRRDTNKDILCYVDSSIADAENRRSTYGYIISLGGNILQYKTRQELFQ